MYEYKFEKIEISCWSGKAKSSYEEVVHEYASQGWRLKQLFAPPTYPGGMSPYIELVFEREV